MPEVVAKINAARAAGADVTADTYAYTAWYNDFSAFIPPWAHDGGTAKLVERLKDPATREKIRKDMLTASKDWDNEWQEIPGPEAVMIGAVENPTLLPMQGKRLSEIAKLWNKDPMDALFDFLIQDPSTGVAVFGMSQPDVTLALGTAMGRDRQRFRRHFARGNSGAGASSSSCLRNVPAHSGESMSAKKRF